MWARGYRDYRAAKLNEPQRSRPRQSARLVRASLGLMSSLTISFLRGDTPDPACTKLPDRFYQQFTQRDTRHPGAGRYERGCSILVMPSSFREYWSTPNSYWLRQRVRRALRDGYDFGTIDRNDYLDDILAINTSLMVRQGRPMASAYLSRPAPISLPTYGCPRHCLRSYGVTRDGHLWAYAWIYQVGQMCLISTILGHGDHQSAGIVPLLVSEAIRHQWESAGLRYAMYNLHASGTPGLRFFKEHLGFQPYDVDWILDAAGSPHQLAAG
jgi:hypothetical protein